MYTVNYTDYVPVNKNDILSWNYICNESKIKNVENFSYESELKCNIYLEYLLSKLLLSNIENNHEIYILQEPINSDTSVNKNLKNKYIKDIMLISETHFGILGGNLTSYDEYHPTFLLNKILEYMLDYETTLDKNFGYLEFSELCPSYIYNKIVLEKIELKNTFSKKQIYLYKLDKKLIYTEKNINLMKLQSIKNI